MKRYDMSKEVEIVIASEKQNAFELLAQCRMLVGESEFFTSLETVFTCHADVADLLRKTANLYVPSETASRFRDELSVILTSLLVAFVDRDLMHRMYKDCIEYAFRGFRVKLERKLKETQEQKDNGSINGKGEEILKEFSA